jgi:hypothetical protein
VTSQAGSPAGVVVRCRVALTSNPLNVEIS